MKETRVSALVSRAKAEAIPMLLFGIIALCVSEQFSRFLGRFHLGGLRWNQVAVHEEGKVSRAKREEDSFEKLFALFWIMYSVELQHSHSCTRIIDISIIFWAIIFGLDSSCWFLQRALLVPEK